MVNSAQYVVETILILREMPTHINIILIPDLIKIGSWAEHRDTTNR